MYLGFSLKPPKWLRNVARQVAGQIKVNAPLPSGNVQYGPEPPEPAADLTPWLLGGGALLALLLLRRPRG